MANLSKDEEGLLKLPSSKIIVSLYLKKMENEKKKPIWKRQLGTTIGRVIAISAFIAAILPLFKLNQSALEYFAKRRELASILQTAERLIEVGGNEAADGELAKAAKIDPSDTMLLNLRSYIDLRTALRNRQDVHSLRQLEIHYDSVLEKYPNSAYLMGTAFIGVELEKAQEYLDKASMLNKGKDKSLEIRILSGHIWLLSRRFQKDRKIEHLELADQYYVQAKQVIKDIPNGDSIDELIPLYTHYSFIAAGKEGANIPVADLSSLELSQLSFDAAVKTRDPLLISKTAKALAEKLKDKDLPDPQTARALVIFGLGQAKVAEDERGIVFGNHTLAQLDHLLYNFDDAERSASQSLEGSVRITDIRMQILNRTLLAKIELCRGEYRSAREYIDTTRVLGKADGDDNATWEMSVMEIFSNLLNPDSSGDDVSDAFARLGERIPNDFQDLRDCCEKWSDLTSRIKKGENVDKPNQFNFDSPLEETVFGKLLSNREWERILQTE